MSNLKMGAGVLDLLKERGMSVTTFSKRVGITRAYAYRLFEKDTIKEPMYSKMLEVLGAKRRKPFSVVVPAVSAVEGGTKSREDLVREIEYLKQRVQDLERIIATQDLLIKRQ